MVDLFRNQKWDLVDKRGTFYWFSGLLTLAGIIALFTWGLTLGIDFKGGLEATYHVSGTLPDHAKIQDAIRTKLASSDGANDIAVTNVEIQVLPSASENGDDILVKALSSNLEADQNVILEKISKVINAAVGESGVKIDNSAKVDSTATISSTISEPSSTTTSAPVTEKPASGSNQIGNGVTLVGHEAVGGTVKDDLISHAIIALIFGTILIMLWIWIRYNIGGMGWKYSVAGIIALFHDLFTLVGVFAILHNFLVVNSPFVAALLTVLGYSIHDTIVIFDRIRENIRLKKGNSFAETVNISLLETLARSVNTVLTVLFTLVALLLFGGPSLRDFVAAMLIGVIVGGYSSICIASQLLVSWAKGKDREMHTFDAPVAALAGGANIEASVITPKVAPSAPAADAPATDAQTAIQAARQAGKSSKRKR